MKWQRIIKNDLLRSESFRNNILILKRKTPVATCNRSPFFEHPFAAGARATAAKCFSAIQPFTFLENRALFRQRPIFKNTSKEKVIRIFKAKN